jgi:hypothetical protein
MQNGSHRWFAWRAPSARPREVVRDEQGFTLVELLIAVTTLLILFAMTVPIVDTLFSTIARVNNTYINVNQLLPVSTNLQRFIRSAVEPGPTSGGVPVPAFITGSITPTSMTFYTNIGDPNGPAEIVASCTSSTPSSGLCNAGGTFTVTVAKANAGTCPPAGSACTWGAAMPLITVDGVSNANDDQPLFEYTLLIATAGSTSTTYTTPVVGNSTITSNVYTNGSMTYSCIPSAPNTPSTPYSAVNPPPASCLYGADTTTFARCTSTGSTSGNVLANCPSAEIYAVTIDLQVNGVSTGRTAGGPSEDDSTVYLLSPESSQYQAMVG